MFVSAEEPVLCTLTKETDFANDCVCRKGNAQGVPLGERMFSS